MSSRNQDLAKVGLVNLKELRIEAISTSHSTKITASKNYSTTRVQQFIKKDHCFIRNSLIGAPLQKVQLGVQGGFFDGQC